MAPRAPERRDTRRCRHHLALVGRVVHVLLVLVLLLVLLLVRRRRHLRVLRTQQAEEKEMAAAVEVRPQRGGRHDGGARGEICERREVGCVLL